MNSSGSERSENLLWCLSLWPVVATIAGCSSPPPLGPIARDPAPPTIISVDADWDDLLASAVVAASQTETAVLGSSLPSSTQMVIDVTTVRDEPVEVRAERLTDPVPSEGPVPIQLSCRYGLFGDAHEQQRFLDAMARRLADLRGVDYRKVR